MFIFVTPEVSPCIPKSTPLLRYKGFDPVYVKVP